MFYFHNHIFSMFLFLDILGIGTFLFPMNEKANS